MSPVRMISLFAVVLGVCVVSLDSAVAQGWRHYGAHGWDYYTGYHPYYPVYPNYPYYGGMTAEMGAGIGYGYAAAGQAALDRAQSEATLNYQRAYNQYLQNRGVEMDLEQQQQDNFQKFVGMDSEDRQAQQDSFARQMESLSAEHRLMQHQIDRENQILNWPLPLRAQVFQPYRAEIDLLFSQRTPANSGEGSTNANLVDEQCKELMTVLKANHDKMSPSEFMASEQFINSLTYEAKFPVKQ